MIYAVLMIELQIIFNTEAFHYEHINHGVVFSQAKVSDVISESGAYF